MTILATWHSEERLWIASDSRLSDGGGTLIEEGVKIFELPVVCRGPSAAQSGFLEDVYHASRVGLACGGSSLLYHQIHANLLALLGNLIGARGAVPSLGQIADFTAEVATQYVRSLGLRLPDSADQLQLLIGGWCPVTQGAGRL
jgi:hypothetical protein